MSHVNWLIAAQRDLQNAMPLDASPEMYADVMSMIAQRLARTFPSAPAIVVRKRLHGYTNPIDRHILLVEVVHRSKTIKATQRAIAGAEGAEQPRSATNQVTTTWPEFCGRVLGMETLTSAHIIKLANDPALLRRELENWEDCRPIGMRHDSILMQLRPGARGPKGAVVSLVYDDANHVIGAGSIMSLDEAVLECCEWGTPGCASLADVIEVIYEHLGADFYVRSKELPDPGENLERLRAWKNRKLDTWLSAWKDDLAEGPSSQPERKRTRREVVGMLSYDRNRFIDPVDYLESVMQSPERCPLMLWGCSDGDLHGRNVLVSIIGDKVKLPAVFDYEDMGRSNPVGWDFVKLETELKVRALTRLVTGPLPQFLFQVLDFECFLAGCSLGIHNGPDHAEPRLGHPGLDRLATLVLTIRRQAKEHLQTRRQRDRRWLEEYYFLLACYGVCAARFDAYQPFQRQVAAAYVAAGVAARQLSRPTYHLERSIQDKAERAVQYLKVAMPGFRAAGYVLRPDRAEMSYHARLEFARRWVRSKVADYRDGAIRILETLEREYPHVLEIEDELALAYLEKDADESCEKLIARVKSRYEQLSEEFLGREGRYWKKKGDAERPSDPGVARGWYRRALDAYAKAYAIRRHYYPGINVAGLQFVVGLVDEAKATASLVLASLEGPQSPEETAWILATKGDAQLIHERNSEAEALYSRAVRLAESDPRGVAAMRRQVELLVSYAPLASTLRDHWSDARLGQVFGDIGHVFAPAAPGGTRHVKTSKPAHRPPAHTPRARRPR
jgi:hypothetical protein